MTTKIYSIEDIKHMLNEVLQGTEVEKAVLFGSYAKRKPSKKVILTFLLTVMGKLKD